MTESIEDLYKEIILDHYRRPRNRGSLLPPARNACAYNPLCGDEITIWVDIDENDTITDIKLDGKGCAISQASGSMMSTLLQGKSLTEARTVFLRFKSMLGIGKNKTDIEIFDPEAPAGSQLGDAEALKSVRQFPSRVKCATLAWNAFEEALGQDTAVSL